MYLWNTRFGTQPMQVLGLKKAQNNTQRALPARFGAEGPDK